MVRKSIQLVKLLEMNYFHAVFGNEIVLQHSRFESGTYRTCNRIIAHSINTTSDCDGIKYISQLIIQLDMNKTLEGRTVECIYDNGLCSKVIGIHYYTGI